MFITSDLKLKQGWVYILSNKHRNVLYIGVTNDLIKRVDEHRNGKDRKSFTFRYNCFDLIYYEHFGRIDEAIVREKQLKNWRKDWKLNLVKAKNPDLMDLYDGFLNGEYLWE
jgi:putative endonuclease